MLLITGITGHSGKYFLKELENNHYTDRIKVIIRNKDSVEFIHKSSLNIEVLIGDLDDEAFLNLSMKEVDNVFHIASIFYSEKVVKASVINNIKRIILVHTTGIYSKYKSASFEYQQIENTVNQLIKSSNNSIEVTILRPTMIFGYLNDRNMIKFIKYVDTFPIMPVIDNGQGLIQPVHGKDLGKAYYQVLMSNKLKSDYILSGEKQLTLKELFILIAKHLNKQIRIISVPSSLAVFGAQCLKVLSFNKIDYVERIQRMTENRSFKHELASQDFDYSPNSFEENLKDEVEQYIESKRLKQ